MIAFDDYAWPLFFARSLFAETRCRSWSNAARAGALLTTSVESFVVRIARSKGKQLCRPQSNEHVLAKSSHHDRRRLRSARVQYFSAAL
jgi:hypothetical protein